MFSAHTMPWAEPTCASISLAVTSPMAQMPGTLVDMRSSISTAPRSLSFTPNSSSPRPLPFGPEADGNQGLFGFQKLFSAFFAGDLHLDALLICHQRFDARARSAN